MNFVEATLNKFIIRGKHPFPIRIIEYVEDIECLVRGVEGAHMHTHAHISVSA